MWRYRDIALKQNTFFMDGVAPWSLEVGDAFLGSVFPVLPDGCCDVVWRATPDGAWEPRLLPPTVRGFLVPLSAGDRFCGMRFLPGRVRELFNVSALDIPSEGIALTQPLWRNPEQALIHILTQDNREKSQVSLVQALMSGLSPAEVCQEFGVRERTLHRRVYAVAGCSPKSLQRIWRLRRAMTLSVGRSTPSWCDIALEAGYADQPHMIRDCRALMGCTPTCLFGMLTQHGMTDSFNP